MGCGRLLNLDLQVISRVDTPSDDHWVIEFNKFLGIPHENVYLCRVIEEKGNLAACLGLTHFVDNRLDCLKAVSAAIPTCKCYYYDNFKHRIQEDFAWFWTWDAFWEFVKPKGRSDLGPQEWITTTFPPTNLSPEEWQGHFGDRVCPSSLLSREGSRTS